MYRQGGGRYYQQGGGGLGLGFPMTPMVRNLIVINAVLYLLQETILDPRMQYEVLFLSVPGVLSGYFWQPFTYMWLHGSLMHLFFNMLSLWMFAPQLESAWGPQRFLQFYLACGLGAGVIILLGNATLLATPEPTLGASGAIFGVLTAFSVLWPNRTIMLLFPPIPLRAIYFIPFLFLMTYFLQGGGNISHIGHLGGVITAGIILRSELRKALNLNGLNLGGLRYKWHRYRMRGRLRSIQKEEWERRRRSRDDGPNVH